MNIEQSNNDKNRINITYVGTQKNCFNLRNLNMIYNVSFLASSASMMKHVYQHEKNEDKILSASVKSKSEKIDVTLQYGFDDAAPVDDMPIEIDDDDIAISNNANTVAKISSKSNVSRQSSNDLNIKSGDNIENSNKREAKIAATHTIDVQGKANIANNVSHTINDKIDIQHHEQGKIDLDSTINKDASLMQNSKLDIALNAQNVKASNIKTNNTSDVYKSKKSSKTIKQNDSKQKSANDFNAITPDLIKQATRLSSSKIKNITTIPHGVSPSDFAPTATSSVAKSKTAAK